MLFSHVFLPGIALLILIQASAPGQKLEVLATDDAIEIPIEEVWSNRIPGTRDIFELEPKVPPNLMKLPRERRSYVNGDTLTQQINKSLSPQKYEERLEHIQPLRIFAVPGHGQAALRGAHGVLVDGKVPRHAFSRGDNITLVFFSTYLSPPIQFRSITRKASRITIHYQIVFSEGNIQTPEHYAIRTPENYVHLALIPITAVQPKQLVVEVHRVPSENPEDEKILLEPASVLEEIPRMISGPCRIDIR